LIRLHTAYTVWTRAADLKNLRGHFMTISRSAESIRRAKGNWQRRGLSTPTFGPFR